MQHTSLAGQIGRRRRTEVVAILITSSFLARVGLRVGPDRSPPVPSGVGVLRTAGRNKIAFLRAFWAIRRRSLYMRARSALVCARSRAGGWPFGAWDWGQEVKTAMRVKSHFVVRALCSKLFVCMIQHFEPHQQRNFSPAARSTLW